MSEGFRPNIEKKEPASEVDFDVTSEGPTSVDFDVSSEETIKKSLEVAAADATAKQALEERLAKLAGRDPEELFVGRSNVLEFQHPAEAQTEKTIPFAPEEADIAEVNAARAEQKREAAELKAFQEQLRKAA